MSVEAIEARSNKENRGSISEVLGEFMIRSGLKEDALNGFKVVAEESSLQGIYQAEVHIPAAAEDVAGPVVREALEVVQEDERAIRLAAVDADGVIDERVIDLAAPGPVVEELAEALGVVPEYVG